jgi:hypothetical protein
MKTKINTFLILAIIFLISTIIAVWIDTDFVAKILVTELFGFALYILIKDRKAIIAIIKELTK